MTILSHGEMKQCKTLMNNYLMSHSFLNQTVLEIFKALKHTNVHCLTTAGERVHKRAVDRSIVVIANYISNYLKSHSHV